MATTGILHFRKLKEGADPADPISAYEPDPQSIEVFDARQLQQEDLLALGSAGFTLVDHVSAITDWSNDEALASTYHDEVCDVIKRLTCAAHVFGNKETLISRCEGSSTQDGPVHMVHHDFAPEMKRACEWAIRGKKPKRSSWSTEQRIAWEINQQFIGKDSLPERMAAAGITAQELAQSRVLVLHTWRPTTDGPLQRCPLTIADRRTVSAAELANGCLGEAYYGLTRRRGQKFYYYPGQTQDELLVFVGYDSDAAEHAPCAHSAFEDNTAPPDAAPRCSIEMRCLVLIPRRQPVQEPL